MAKLDGKISFEEVRRLLDYDQHTGVFRWREARHGGMFKGYPHGHKFAPGTGPIAGLVKKRGHVEIKLFGQRYMAHRLAWVWMTGQWPAKDIDHKDLNPGNNAWLNLREATQQQNNWNTAVKPWNIAGLKGVSPQYGYKRKPTGKWRAQIKINGKVTYLGAYNTPEEAHAVYKRMVETHRGVFARA